MPDGLNLCTGGPGQTVAVPRLLPAQVWLWSTELLAPSRQEEGTSTSEPTGRHPAWHTAPSIISRCLSWKGQTVVSVCSSAFIFSRFQDSWISFSLLFLLFFIHLQPPRHITTDRHYQPAIRLENVTHFGSFLDCASICPSLSSLFEIIAPLAPSAWRSFWTSSLCVQQFRRFCPAHVSIFPVEHCLTLHTSLQYPT